MARERELIVVPEGDDEETGEHTCWAIEMQGTDRKHFIWISKYDDKDYRVETSHGRNLADDKIYKTLGGAKRKAEEIAARQESRDFFTD